MSLLSVLGVVFVVLKLTGFIFWSWWLVLLPFYLVPLIFLAAFFSVANSSSARRFYR